MRLRFVDDVANSPTVRLDLNDGTKLRLLRRDFNLGTVETEIGEVVSVPLPSSKVTYARLPLAEMTFRLRSTETSADRLMALQRQLATELARKENLLEYRAEGMTYSVFFETYASALVPIFHGQEFPTDLKLDDPEGLPIVLRRHPYARWSRLPGATNLVKNATLMLDDNVDGVPNGWTANNSPTGSVIRDDSNVEAHEWVTDAALNSGYRQQVTGLTAAQSYTFQAEMRRVAGSGRVRLFIDWRDAANANTGNSVGAFTTATDFTQIVLTATAPAGTTNAFVIYQGEAGGGTFQARKVMFESGSSASTFRAGSESLTSRARGMMVYNPGNLPCDTIVKIQPQLADAVSPQVSEVYIGRRSRGEQIGLDNLPELSGRTMFELEGATTYGSGTTVQSAALASGSAATNNVLRTTFSDTEAWRRRWGLSIDPTDTWAMTGRFRVRLGLRARSASSDLKTVFDIKIHWDQRGSTTPEHAEKRIRLDFSDVDAAAADGAFASHFVEVDAGEINIDTNPALLWIEGHARRVEGTGELEWDCVTLVPVDSFTRLVIPGIEEGGTNVTMFRGDELKVVTEGDAANSPIKKRDETIVLKAQGDKVCTPGETSNGVSHTLSVPAGRHQARVVCELRNANFDSDKQPGDSGYEDNVKPRLGFLRIMEVTGAGTTTERARIGLRCRPRRKLSVIRKTVNFKFAAAANIRFEVEFTNKPSGSDGRIVVQHVKLLTERVADDSSELVLDGEDERAIHRTTSGNRIGPLDRRGPFLRLEPGLNYLQLGGFEELGPGYDDVVVREEGEAASLERTRCGNAATAGSTLNLKVTVDVHPRSYPA